ncbi:hypothetical protein PPUJ20028_42140 [Pseudomonas putida]|uniref:Uncharacterized protein n=1 Tax=Pseudomonas putida TaxID=303 RepID=A0AA37RK59_PSEPU|nr:hypothetical protein PPUJ20028_42140 [Pseudomonas putida]GLO37161.1 hypothetical protein PPUN14671_39970 [Pseudomonas putida]
MLTHFVQAKAFGLFGKQAFKAFGAGEVKFETVRHVYSRALGYLTDEATHHPAMFARMPFQQACGWPFQAHEHAAKGRAARPICARPGGKDSLDHQAV